MQMSADLRSWVVSFMAQLAFLDDTEERQIGVYTVSRGALYSYLEAKELCIVKERHPGHD